MARLAKKDTFMYEVAGPGAHVRRQVMAGQFVPDSYFAGEDTDSDSFDEVEGPRTIGLGAAPSDYKHQVGVSAEDQVQRRQNARKGGKAPQAQADGSTVTVDTSQAGPNAPVAG